MRYIGTIIFCFAIILSVQGQTPTGFAGFSSVINADSIDAWIKALASEKFGGREAGTQYEKKVAAWIADKMKAADLKETGFSGNGSYIQRLRFFSIHPKKITLLSGKDTLRNGRDFYLTPATHSTDSFRFVYCGTCNEENIGKLEVKGKIVIVHEAISAGASEDKHTDFSLEKIITRLEKSEARGICLIYPDEYFRYIPQTPMYGDIEKSYMLPEANPAQVDSFLYFIAREKVLKTLTGMNIPSYLSVPVKNNVNLLPGHPERSWNLQALLQRDAYWSANVLGMVEGSIWKNEVVVISAHYDHLGRKGNKYYPGADDNATGVAALLSIARAFQQAAEQGYRPARTLLFAAFSAEEMGMLGSAWYARNSVGKTVINLNMDMLGRSDSAWKSSKPTVYYLTDSMHYSRFSPWIRNLANSYSPDLLMDNRLNEDDFLDYYHRSDQLSFAVDNIPFVVFTSGEHADYHQLSDVPGKIETEQVVMIARLVAAMAWDYAFGEPLF